MKVKTSELNGVALDWAVAKCEGLLTPIHGESVPRVVFYSDQWQKYMRLNPPPQTYYSDRYEPSSDPSQAWPIIDRGKITTVCAEGDYNPDKAGTPECYNTYWVATIGRLSASTVYGSQGDDWGSCFQIEANAMQGTTSLIAAMRCFVASKLGDEVDISEELLS